MLQRFLSPACLIAVVLVPIVLEVSPSRAEPYASDCEGGSIVPDQATWAAYYRKNARVLLGPERRLPNGVSWRLHLDTGTKLALPRITWMPDTRSQWTANGMLDMVHGGAMLCSHSAGRELERINDLNRRDGYPLLEYDRPIVQTDVGLTYVTPRLISLVDLGFVVSEGSGVPAIIRGLTFDLLTRRMFHVEACPGVTEKPRSYLFQFGNLVRVCDRDTYLRFVQLLMAKAALVAERTARSKDKVVQECSEKAGPFIGEDQEIVLYLTFEGLAVHNTEYWPNSRLSYCTLQRSPVNPVILPYRELEPFMIPGAWRDELLKLQ